MSNGWQCLVTDAPPAPGTRIVALHADGSHADLFFFREDGHVITQTGRDFEEVFEPIQFSDWLWDSGYLFWIALPEGMRLFFEEAGNDLPQ